MTSPSDNSYPEDSIQDVLGFKHLGDNGWWTVQSPVVLERGALVYVFVPHANVAPLELVPSRGVDSRSHATAETKITPFLLSARHAQPDPPVSALPQFPNDRFQIVRGKRRPAIVISNGNAYPELRGVKKWITTPLMFVAPCFGADDWPAVLVDSIRRVQHPQYLWDYLPLDGRDSSIVRLDQMFPIHRTNTKAYKFTGFRLSPEAMELIDDWLGWNQTGTLDRDGCVIEVHNELKETYYSG